MGEVKVEVELENASDRIAKNGRRIIMTLTLHLLPEVEVRLRALAQTRGVDPVNVYCPRVQSAVSYIEHEGYVILNGA
jgi:hypothetical protein